MRRIEYISEHERSLLKHKLIVHHLYKGISRKELEDFINDVYLHVFFPGYAIVPDIQKLIPNKLKLTTNTGCYLALQRRPLIKEEEWVETAISFIIKPLDNKIALPDYDGLLLIYDEEYGPRALNKTQAA